MILKANQAVRFAPLDMMPTSVISAGRVLDPMRAEKVNNPEDYREISTIDYACGKGLLNAIVV